MAASELIDLSLLLDGATCFALVRQRRWLEDVRCPAVLHLVAVWRSATGFEPQCMTLTRNVCSFRLTTP